MSKSILSILRETIKDLAFGFSSNYLKLKKVVAVNSGKHFIEEKEPSFIIYVGGVEVGRMPQFEMIVLKETVFAQTIDNPWAWLHILKSVFRQMVSILGTAMLATPVILAWLIYLFEDDNSALLTLKALQFFKVLFFDTFHLALILCILVRMAKLAWKMLSDSNAEGILVLKTLSRDNPFQYDLEIALRRRFKILNPGELTIQLFV